MKWLIEVVDELAKITIDLGKGLLLACFGAVLLGKITPNNSGLVFGVIGLAVVFILAGLYLTKIYRDKNGSDDE